MELELNRSFSEEVSERAEMPFMKVNGKSRISLFFGRFPRMLVGLRFRGVEIEPHIVLLAGRWSFLRIVRFFRTFSEELL